jgi:hypothetical protein
MAVELTLAADPQKYRQPFPVGDFPDGTLFADAPNLAHR